MKFATKGIRGTGGANSLRGNVIKLNTTVGSITFSPSIMNKLGWDKNTKVGFAWDNDPEALYPFYIYEDKDGYKLSDKYSITVKSQITNFLEDFPKMSGVNIICDVVDCVEIEGMECYGVEFMSESKEVVEEESKEVVFN